MAEWLCSGLQSRVQRFDSATRLQVTLNKSNYRNTQCPGGGIGRRKGLKIPRLHGRAGSIPAPGTIFKNNDLPCFLHLVFNLILPCMFSRVDAV